MLKYVFEWQILFKNSKITTLRAFSTPKICDSIAIKHPNRDSIYAYKENHFLSGNVTQYFSIIRDESHVHEFFE